MVGLASLRRGTARHSCFFLRVARGGLIWIVFPYTQYSSRLILGDNVGCFGGTWVWVSLLDCSIGIKPKIIC